MDKPVEKILTEFRLDLDRPGVFAPSAHIAFAPNTSRAEREALRREAAGLGLRVEEEISFNDPAPSQGRGR